MSNTKPCPDCKQIKSVDDFHNNKKTSDGKATYCKVCLLARGAAYRLANPDKVRATNKASKKKNAVRAKATKKLYVAANREKVNAGKRDWYARNKDKAREMYQRSYAKSPESFIINAQKRYARLKGVERNLITKKEMARLYRTACVYCGSSERIEIDHIQPIDKNGRHSIGNLVSACMSCNRSKSDLYVMEWRLREIKKLGR